MFYYLNGILSLPEASTAVIDCGGVGYKLTISAVTLQKLAGKEGGKVLLYTYLDVKEDALDLYGFIDENELSLFRQLITVSGVGPKAAVSVLSALSPSKLVAAISAGDVKAITAANGVGKKIAERIILELKDKLGAGRISGMSADGFEDAAAADWKDDAVSDALNALMVLGYSRAEATAALRRIDTKNQTTESVIRLALGQLMKS